MPRSLAAQNWKPNPTEQQMIDKMAKYLILAEQISGQLQKLKPSIVQQLYDQLSVVFTGDPVKYPSAFAAMGDKRGREKFAARCHAICFPPASKLPRTPEEYIIQYFTTVACLQSQREQDFAEHPFGGEIAYRANQLVLRELGGQAAVDSAIAFERDWRDKPMNFLGQKVRCYDKDLGRVVECIVADCGASALTGDFFVLKDANGNKRQVTGDEFHEMKVD